MTHDEWVAEVRRRIAINEGCRLTMYHDTEGIPTIAYGFNLERADAADTLRACGVADVGAVMAGALSLTQEQADILFDRDLPGYISDARASLMHGIFDALSEARQFVIVDLVYNLGAAGWEEFGQTRLLIAQAQAHKEEGNTDIARMLFFQASDHLQRSPWYTQVGNRAKRDVAMLRSSVWCDPEGDGSDV